MTKGVASHDYHGFNSPTFRCITAKSASDGDRSCVGWVLMERRHVEDVITLIVSARHRVDVRGGLHCGCGSGQRHARHCGNARRRGGPSRVSIFGGGKRRCRRQRRLPRRRPLP